MCGCQHGPFLLVGELRGIAILSVTAYDHVGLDHPLSPDMIA